MQRFVETIHLYKTKPDIVVPLLKRYPEELHAFHVPVFQKVPRPYLPGHADLPRDVIFI